MFELSNAAYQASVQASQGITADKMCGLSSPEKDKDLKNEERVRIMQDSSEYGKDFFTKSSAGPVCRCEWFKHDRDTQLANINELELKYAAKFAHLEANDTKMKGILASRDAKCVALITQTKAKNERIYAQSLKNWQECNGKVAHINEELQSYKQAFNDNAVGTGMLNKEINHLNSCIQGKEQERQNTVDQLRMQISENMENQANIDALQQEMERRYEHHLQLQNQIDQHNVGSRMLNKEINQLNSCMHGKDQELQHAVDQLRLHTERSTQQQQSHENENQANVAATQQMRKDIENRNRHQLQLQNQIEQLQQDKVVFLEKERRQAELVAQQHQIHEDEKRAYQLHQSELQIQVEQMNQREIAFLEEKGGQDELFAQQQQIHDDEKQACQLHQSQLQDQIVVLQKNEVAYLEEGRALLNENHTLKSQRQRDSVQFYELQQTLGRERCDTRDNEIDYKKTIYGMLNNLTRQSEAAMDLSRSQETNASLINGNCESEMSHATEMSTVKNAYAADINAIHELNIKYINELNATHDKKIDSHNTRNASLKARIQDMEETMTQMFVGKDLVIETEKVSLLPFKSAAELQTQTDKYEGDEQLKVLEKFLESMTSERDSFKERLLLFQKEQATMTVEYREKLDSNKVRSDQDNEDLRAKMVEEKKRVARNAIEIEYRNLKQQEEARETIRLLQAAADIYKSTAILQQHQIDAYKVQGMANLQNCKDVSTCTLVEATDEKDTTDVSSQTEMDMCDSLDISSKSPKVTPVDFKMSQQAGGPSVHKEVSVAEGTRAQVAAEDILLSAEIPEVMREAEPEVDFCKKDKNLGNGALKYLYESYKEDGNCGDIEGIYKELILTQAVHQYDEAAESIVMSFSKEEPSCATDHHESVEDDDQIENTHEKKVSVESQAEHQISLTVEVYQESDEVKNFDEAEEINPLDLCECQEPKNKSSEVLTTIDTSAKADVHQAVNGDREEMQFQSMHGCLGEDMIGDIPDAKQVKDISGMMRMLKNVGRFFTRKEKIPRNKQR